MGQVSTSSLMSSNSTTSPGPILVVVVLIFCPQFFWGSDVVSCSSIQTNIITGSMIGHPHSLTTNSGLVVNCQCEIMNIWQRICLFCRFSFHEIVAKKEFISKWNVSRAGDFNGESRCSACSEVDCRGSRRTTAKNQTTTPAMGLSRSVFLRLLLNQRAHNKNAKRVAAVLAESSSVEQVREIATAAVCEERICFSRMKIHSWYLP